MALVEFNGELDQPAAQGGVVPFTGQLDQPDPKIRTPKEELLRALGRTARVGVTAATGLGGAIADVPFQLANVGRAAFDKPPLELPSAAQQKLMTKMGLPQSEGTFENVVDTLATMVGGAGLDPVSRALQVATAASPAAQAYGQIPATVKAKSIKELGDAGYKIPPSVADAGIGARTLEGLGGKARTAEMMAAENENVTNALARKALNLPKDAPLTPEVIKGTTDTAFKQGYEPIINVGKIGVGKAYRQDLLNIVKRLEGDNSFPAAQKPEVAAEVKKYLFYTEKLPDGSLIERPLQSFTGKDAVIQARQLRLDAADAFKQGNNALALAQRGIAKAIEDNIERNLGAGSQMLRDFKDARVLMAKAHAVEDALVPGTGSVDALKMAAQASRKNLTGELATIAKAGSVLRKAAEYPKSGTPPPINPGDQMIMGAGGLSTMLNPLLGGAVVATPLARAGARYGVSSDAFQKAFVHGTGQAPGPGIFGNPLTQRAIPSLYPLFTGGEE